MKGRAHVEAMTTGGFITLSAPRLCGFTLAHTPAARSGDPVVLVGVPRQEGRLQTRRSPTSRRATPIRTERDYLAFVAAVESGRIEARHGV